jgi:Fasciclin domain
MPVSAILLEPPQDSVPGEGRPTTRAEHELMGVAMVVEPDIETDNGVIHGIDLVLLPPRGATVVLSRGERRKMLLARSIPGTWIVTEAGPPHKSKSSRSGKRGKEEPSIH